MERETKKIKVPSGVELEMKTYITGGEAREISNVFLEGVEIAVDESGTAKAPAISAEKSSKAQDKAIEMLVVSVNGSKENILQSVLDLRKEDFNFIVSELDEIQNGLGEKKTK